jgi:crossover junction endodeoxyribonuclease RusA
VITLVLPYPISANRYWKAITIPGRTMMAPTKEATAYKAEVARVARSCGLAKPFPWRVAVELDLYPHRPQDWARRASRDPVGWDDDVRCIDLGNAEKVLSDALQGIVFNDDKWVWDLHKRRKEPDGEGRVVLRIRPLQRVSRQGELLGAAA